MLSKFFLERPVFAWVIAIIIMAVGILLGSTVFRIYSDWKLKKLFES